MFNVLNEEMKKLEKQRLEENALIGLLTESKEDDEIEKIMDDDDDMEEEILNQDEDADDELISTLDCDDDCDDDDDDDEYDNDDCDADPEDGGGMDFADDSNTIYGGPPITQANYGEEADIVFEAYNFFDEL